MVEQRVPVLIAGGGPVGLTLAMDLGWRGIECLVVDPSETVGSNPRCNTTAARSMEHFRRLGVADRIRAAGLPGDYPTTVRYRTRFADGHELFSIPLPSSDEVRAGVGRDSWVTPEPQHRISQLYLEPILREHAATFPAVTLEFGTRLDSFEQDEDGVTALVVDRTGASRRIRAQYLVGCDGAHSTVRRTLGIRLSGTDALGANLSAFLRSPQLGAMKRERAWSTLIFNPDNTSVMIAIDGDELWLSHHKFPVGTDTSGLDLNDLVARAVGFPVEFEVIGAVHWTPRRLVADRYGHGRVFLAGDAAHLWIPMAGFGMNAGIQEATTLGWMLAAVLDGWADPQLLRAYELERRPVGETVSRAVANVRIYDTVVDPRIEEDSPEGARLRESLAEHLLREDQGQYIPDGLSFSLHYGDSPVIVPDGTPPPPPLRISGYEPSARPGCRLPHFWRADGSSVLDHLGAGLTLVRVGEAAPPVDGLTGAALQRGIPLTVLDLAEPLAAQLYGARLLLVRPDQHVAWRGDAPPDDPSALLDRVRGALLLEEATR